MGEITTSPVVVLPKLVLADLLVEEGQEDLSWAFRWMAKHEKWPEYRATYPATAHRPSRPVPERFRWAWYSESHLGPAHALLPRIIFLPLAHYQLLCGQKLYASWEEAVGHLSEVLAEYRRWGC